MTSETHNLKKVPAYLSKDHIEDLELIAKYIGIQGYSACIRFAVRTMANRIRTKQKLLNKI